MSIFQRFLQKAIIEPTTLAVLKEVRKELKKNDRATEIQLEALNQILIILKNK